MLSTDKECSLKAFVLSRVFQATNWNFVKSVEWDKPLFYDSLPVNNIKPVYEFCMFMINNTKCIEFLIFPGSVSPEFCL